MIRASNLGYTFASGRVGLASLDLEVNAGELIALVGPNGSGKTTLLRLFAGDLAPTTGALSVATPNIGFAAAQPIHFDELTGRENAQFFACANAANAIVDRDFSAFDLIADADIPAGEYSFGMQRKLLLAEALVHDPALLLLDEPTIGLDPPALGVLTKVLQDHVHAGDTVIIGTNDVHAAMLATRVVFLHRGKKIADAKPDDLLGAARATTRIDVRVSTEPTRAPGFPAGVTAMRSAGTFSIEASDALVLPQVCAALLDAGARIGAVHMREPDLGDVFLTLTGEVLRHDPVI